MFQLSIFAVFLFLRRKQCPSNLMLGIQLISQATGILAGILFEIYGYSTTTISVLIYFTGSFMFLWGPTFYLYVKQVSYKDYRFTQREILHFTPFILVLLFGFIRFISEQNTTSMLFNSLYPNIFVRVQVLSYIILSSYTLYAVRGELMGKYSSISKTNWSWIRLMVIGFTSAYIISIPLIIYRYYMNEHNLLVEFGNLLPYFIYFNIIFFKAWYNPEIFTGMGENLKYKSSKLTREDAEVLIKGLNEYIKTKKPYLNPDITLNQMAEVLNVSARILSQIINEYFNQNFYDYVNRLRIEESKRMLICDKKRTVSEILYEVGFNTKSAFNTAFKKATGLTPSEYRRKAEKT